MSQTLCLCLCLLLVTLCVSQSIGFEVPKPTESFRQVDAEEPIDAPRTDYDALFHAYLKMGEALFGGWVPPSVKNLVV